MPPLLKLIALVLGEGSVVAVALDADESVGELKKLLCREQQYAFPASGLTLFTAHAAASPNDGGGGVWLRANDPLVRALKKGALAPAALLDEDLEMDPTYPLSDYFSDENAPQLKEIHVLVQLPGANVVAPPAVAASAAVPQAVPPSVAAPLIPVPSISTPATTPVKAPVSVLTPGPEPVVPASSLIVSMAPPLVSAPLASTVPTSTPVALAPVVVEAPSPQPPLSVETLSPAPAPAPVPFAPVATTPVAQSKSIRRQTPPSSRTEGILNRDMQSVVTAVESAAIDLTATPAPVAPSAAKAKKAVAKEKTKRQVKTKVTPRTVAEALRLPPSVTAEEPIAAATAALAAISRSSRRTSTPGEKRKLQTTTWSFRSSALFFYFHPELGNRNLELTCDAFEIVLGTFRNWVTKKEFYPKWVPFVQDMTLRDAMEFMSKELLAQFGLLELHPDAKVAIPEKYVKAAAAANSSSKRPHSEMQTQIQSIESQASGKKLRGSATNTTAGYSASAKTIGSGRIPKYPAQETFLMHHVRLAWETGNPLSTAQIYALLQEEFGRPPQAQGGDDGLSDYTQSEFEIRMGLNSERTAAPLSQWVSRRLESNNWTVHARKVVPKVPGTWHETALQTSVELCEIMRDVDVLISADELFLNFYPRDAQATGTAETAGATEGAEKTGCTVVLGCELFTSTLLPPFTIMASPGSNVTGELASIMEACNISTGGTSQPPNICFQPSHWMDAQSAKQYVAFVTALFPNKQIGLIWDTASSHVSTEVLEYILELGVIVGFIPPGLSSVMQVCDHVFGNKRMIQNDVMTQFVDAKVTEEQQAAQQPPAMEGGKYRVERSSVIKWVNTSVTRLSESSGELDIKKAFRMLGQDPKSPVMSEFVDHLQTLSDETIAQALTDTQLALHLE